MADPSLAGILIQISDQLEDIISRLDTLAVGDSGGGVMSYDYLRVTVPANQTDYEVEIPVPASITYVMFSNSVSFRVNEISAALIPWRSGVEFRISPMRTERLYVTTGVHDTTVEFRTVLTESDLTRNNIKSRR
jgi:hypothetical protein